MAFYCSEISKQTINAFDGKCFFQKLAQSFYRVLFFVGNLAYEFMRFGSLSLSLFLPVNMWIGWKRYKGANSKETWMFLLKYVLLLFLWVF